MAGTGVEIIGVKEFKKFLKVLPDRLQRRVSQQALIASGKPIKDRMIQNLAKHRRTGTLRKSIKVIKAKGRRRSAKEVIVFVGAIKAKNINFLRDGFYARFLEEGTSKQPPRPWAKPALFAGIRAQQRKLGVEFGRRAIKEIKRQARKIIGF